MSQRVFRCLNLKTQRMEWWCIKLPTKVPNQDSSPIDSIKNSWHSFQEAGQSQIGTFGCVNPGMVDCPNQHQNNAMDRLKECSVLDQEEGQRMEAVHQPQSSRNQTALVNRCMGSCSKHSTSLVSITLWWNGPYMDLKSRWKTKELIQPPPECEGNEGASSTNFRRINLTPYEERTRRRHSTCQEL